MNARPRPARSLPRAPSQLGGGAGLLLLALLLLLAPTAIAAEPVAAPPQTAPDSPGLDLWTPQTLLTAAPTGDGNLTLHLANRGADPVQGHLQATPEDAGWSATPTDIPFTLAPGENATFRVHVATTHGPGNGTRLQVLAWRMDASPANGTSPSAPAPAASLAVPVTTGTGAPQPTPPPVTRPDTNETAPDPAPNGNDTLNETPPSNGSATLGDTPSEPGPAPANATTQAKATKTNTTANTTPDHPQEEGAAPTLAAPDPGPGAFLAAHPVAVIAVTASAAAGTASLALLLRRETWRYALLAPLMGLFTRLAKPQVLEHDLRERIHQLIQEAPGITLADLARRTGAPNGMLYHHLHTLERHRYVTSRREAASRRFYPTGARLPVTVTDPLTPMERRILDLLATGPATQPDLAHRLGVSRQAINRHVKALERKGFVTAEERAGVRVLAAAPRGAAIADAAAE